MSITNGSEVIDPTTNNDFFIWQAIEDDPCFYRGLLFYRNSFCKMNLDEQNQPTPTYSVDSATKSFQL